MKHLKTFESFSTNENKFTEFFSGIGNKIKGAVLNLLSKNDNFKKGYEAAKLKLEKDEKLQEGVNKIASENQQELNKMKNEIGSDLEKLTPNDQYYKTLMENPNLYGKDDAIFNMSGGIRDSYFYINENSEDLSNNGLNMIKKYFPQIANYGRILASLVSLAFSFIKSTSVTQGASTGEVSVHPMFFAGFVVLLLWAMFQWIPSKK